MLLTLSILPWAASQGDVGGEAVFTSICSACHQSTGQGIPGAFPPLAGHVGELYAAEDGPLYLASVVLFGLQGPIEVGGVAYDGMMPSHFQLSDADVVSVIDYVMNAWGDAESLEGGYERVTEQTVARARGLGLSPNLVHQRRPDLGGETAGDGEEIVLVEATFAQDQVDRIWSTYNQYCLECHGDDLTGGLIGGAPLSGFVFRQKWGGSSLASLYAYLSTQMPQGSPGSLSDQQYADLLALIISKNGHQAGGAPLTPDPEQLRGIGIRSN
ncbi:MAG: c-type cytochrome [Trueperaceae bacterium]